jgi:hypothetical protein
MIPSYKPAVYPPMSYVSPKTGRQYVLLSVGGAAHATPISDLVMACAVPTHWVHGPPFHSFQAFLPTSSTVEKSGLLKRAVVK